MNAFQLSADIDAIFSQQAENPGRAEQSLKDKRAQYLAARSSGRMILLLCCWSILQLATAHENVTCFQDGQECELTSQNLVEAAITTNWQECSLLCLNSSGCSAFTFFGINSDIPPHNSCFLFSDCKTKVPCNDCVIGIPQVQLLSVV